MWTEKLSAGVLRILTPLGPRYLNPSLTQRIYLLWLFRHFEKLPLQVLSLRQRRFIATICDERRFVSLLDEEAAILGTLEGRLPLYMDTTIPTHSSAPVSDAGASLAELRQRS